MSGLLLSLWAWLPCVFGLALELYAFRYAAAPVEPFATSMANVFCFAVNSRETVFPNIWETGTVSSASLSWALDSLLGVGVLLMGRMIGEQRKSCNGYAFKTPAPNFHPVNTTRRNVPETRRDVPEADKPATR